MKVYPAAFSGIGRNQAGEPMPKAAHEGAGSFTAALDKARAGAPSPADARSPDFSSMTRQSLFDWMNTRIRAGEMTLHESAPFLALSVRVSSATQQPIPMLGDEERVDFLGAAREAIAGAQWRKDRDAVSRFQMALDRMLGANRP